MAQSKSSRNVFLSSVVGLLYLGVGLNSGGPAREMGIIAAVVAVVSGLITVAANRWTLFVQGAMLLPSIAFAGGLLVFAIGIGDSWGGRLSGLGYVLALAGPLIALQLWNFSVASRRVHEA